MPYITYTLDACVLLLYEVRYVCISAYHLINISADGILKNLTFVWNNVLDNFGECLSSTIDVIVSPDTTSVIDAEWKDPSNMVWSSKLIDLL